MATNSKLGKNYTGGDTAPENIKLMLDACKKFPPDIAGDEHKLENARIKLNREANPIGSVPLPMSVKGMVKASFNKLIGNHPELFLDKLGERLAFERSGVRLYEAAIAKMLALNESRRMLQQLEHIRREEAEHMEILVLAIKKLGADPTAMTPGADVTGVLGMGLIQVLTDPRTDAPQALTALLNAELIDNAAWELLIELAMGNGQDEMVEQFEKALAQEEEHLSIIKVLLKDYLDIKEDLHAQKASVKEDCYHVMPSPSGGWDVKRENATRVSRHFSNKKDAVSLGREMSKKAGVKLQIHQQEIRH